MRILFCSHFFYPSVGGIERVSQVLATEFSLAGHTVKVVTSTLESDGTKFLFEVIRRPPALELLRLVLWSEVVFHNNISLRLCWPLACESGPILGYAFLMLRVAICLFIARRCWAAVARGQALPFLLIASNGLDLISGNLASQLRWDSQSCSPDWHLRRSKIRIRRWTCKRPRNLNAGFGGEVR